MNSAVHGTANEPSRQCWRMPEPLWRQLNADYSFTIDAAANAKNAMMRPFWHKSINALKQDWGRQRVWCNPPYDDLGPWVEKASATTGPLACIILPVRADQSWWHAFHPLAERHWLRGRVQFVPPPGVKKSSNAFASVLFLFGSEARPGTDYYRNAKTGEYLYAV